MPSIPSTAHVGISNKAIRAQIRDRLMESLQKHTGWTDNVVEDTKFLAVDDYHECMEKVEDFRRHGNKSRAGSGLSLARLQRRSNVPPHTFDEVPLEHVADFVARQIDNPFNRVVARRDVLKAVMANVPERFRITISHPLPFGRPGASVEDMAAHPAYTRPRPNTTAEVPGLNSSDLIKSEIVDQPLKCIKHEEVDQPLKDIKHEDVDQPLQYIKHEVEQPLENTKHEEVQDLPLPDALLGGEYAELSHRVTMLNKKGRFGAQYRMEDALKQVPDDIDLTPLDAPIAFRSKCSALLIPYSVVIPYFSFPLPTETEILIDNNVYYDCDQVRAMIKIFIQHGHWTLEKFRESLGHPALRVERPQLTDFLEKRGPKDGLKSNAYFLAWEFFHRREKVGLPLRGSSPDDERTLVLQPQDPSEVTIPRPSNPQDLRFEVPRAVRAYPFTEEERALFSEQLDRSKRAREETQGGSKRGNKRRKLDANV
ncbi:hypothetical protein B0T16DRAFT_416978 [Cercophora newfieldiana]|uniref:DUF7726 domain-containing protein n=1 Tax=Cercophora newfieldiana TaxID=92897 RepID=A0AA40CNY1_9PEZI|nr:hypothetical protein B0T16DRAFT_416978 [Cercophora newfieldiana]